MTIRIKAGCDEAYRKHHKAVWPEVVEMIRACNIANYLIFLKDDRL
jgi:L-rhamnose mutarotase